MPLKLLAYEHGIEVKIKDLRPGKRGWRYLKKPDETNGCPFLMDGRCLIYQYRPETCRGYDCRTHCGYYERAMFVCMPPEMIPFVESIYRKGKKRA